MFQAISKPVISQAYRIAQDNDIAQSTLAMAFNAYNNAKQRGKELSVGEIAWAQIE